MEFSYITIVFAVLYIVFFAIGPGAIPWLITSELFDSSARGKATSIACFVNWTCNYLVVLSYPYIQVINFLVVEMVNISSLDFYFVL